MFWFRKNRTSGSLEADIEREIESHLQLEEEELRERGTAQNDAHWAARRAFGNRTRTKEEMRRMWGLRNWAGFRSDLLYGTRVLRRSPAFTVGAVLCLAIGIGASTAIFSMVNSVLLKPLPYTDSERLVRVYTEFTKFPGGGLRRFAVSAPEFREMQRDGRAWDQIEAWVNGGANLAGSGEPVRITASFVSGGMLSMLGVSPALGRWITPQDDAYGAPLTIVLSDGLWKRAFGGDAKVVGREVLLDGQKATVVGVMPSGFNFPPGVNEPAELWTPLQLSPQTLTQRGGHFLSLIAHMRPGASLDQVRRETSVLLQHFAERRAPKFHVLTPDDHPLVLYPFGDEVSASVRKPILMLLGAVGFFLLIACVNVANLLLARASAREREMAVRKAVGASVAQLFRQLLMEGMLLSLIGAAAGTGLAYLALRVIIATNAGMIPRIEEARIDWEVLLFALALAVATGVVFGLAPMAHLVLRPVHDALKVTAGRVQGSASANRFRAALVTVELSLALILLIGAGLLVQAFWKLQRVDGGFRPEGLLTVRLSLTNQAYNDGKRLRAFWERLSDRLTNLPGADSATVALGLPPQRPEVRNDTEIENFVRRPGGPNQNVAHYQIVTEHFFETLGIRLVEGRFIDARDTYEAPKTVVVNQSMARAFWPGESAIGKRIKAGTNDWQTVVGVVADVKNSGLDKPVETELFLPARQLDQNGQTAYVIVKGSGDIRRFANQIRQLVHDIDPAVPVAQVRTMEDVVALSQTRPRFLALMLTVFSGLALALAAFGIYGVIAYAVSQRTTELGIRMALGAQRGAVLKLVLRQGVLMTIAGAVIGCAGAAIVSRSLEGMLFEVSRLDPVVFFGMAGTLGAVAVAACLIPGLRATRIDPIRALRYE